MYINLDYWLPSAKLIFGINRPNIWDKQLIGVQIIVVQAGRKKHSACTKGEVLYTGLDICLCYYIVQPRKPCHHFSSTWKLALVSCSYFLHENCMYLDICSMITVFDCCQIICLFYDWDNHLHIIQIYDTIPVGKIMFPVSAIHKKMVTVLVLRVLT